MTVGEFMEFYGGTRYVQYVHSNDMRALLNTELIVDPVNYRTNIFQIAFQHMAHDRAADIVATQVYRDVLLGEFRPRFQKDSKIMEVLDFPSKKWTLHGVTDEDIWNGKDTYPGLYRLIHARCLCLLIEDPSEILLTLPPHRDVGTPENLTKHFAIPAPWFFKAAEQLRTKSPESLIHFRAAAIRIHYYADQKVTLPWIGEALGIQKTDLLQVLSEAKVIIEAYLHEEEQVFQAKSERLALLWRDIAQEITDYEVPQ